MTLNYDVKPRMANSVLAENLPFGRAKAELEQAGYRVISAEEQAGLRIREGPESLVSKRGNWTREGFIWVPGENHLYFTKSSPIMSSPIEATQANREGNYFCPSKEQIEEGIANSIKISYGQGAIPTDRFEEEITNFAFGKFAEKYEDFLRENEIMEMPIWSFDQDYVNNQINPFSTQLWLCRLSEGSGLIGNCRRNLDWHDGLRGVPNDAEGVAI
jgi:hypothetical protein